MNDMKLETEGVKRYTRARKIIMLEISDMMTAQITDYISEVSPSTAKGLTV